MCNINLFVLQELGDITEGVRLVAPQGMVLVFSSLLFPDHQLQIQMNSCE